MIIWTLSEKIQVSTAPKFRIISKKQNTIFSKTPFFLNFLIVFLDYTNNSIGGD